MTLKFRVLAGSLSLAALSIVAAVVCVLVKGSAPLPRWDLLIFLFLSLAGVGGALAIVRRGTRPEIRGIGTRKYWWPAQRSGLVGFGLWAWTIPVFFALYAALSPSSQAWNIIDAGHTMRTVEVEKVLSSKYVKSGRSGHYSTEVQVSAPFNGGSRTVENRFSASSPIDAGDRVWALYAPDSPALGVLIDDDRDSLERSIGGPVGVTTMLLLVGWIAFCWLLSLPGRMRPGPTTSIRRALDEGRVRVLPVTVSAVGVQVDGRPPKNSSVKRPEPCVKLRMEDGKRLDLYLDQALDPVPLGHLLLNAQANLYWAPPLQDLPYKASVGHAVLILTDGRWVVGWGATVDGSDLPEGSMVPAGEVLPEEGDLRAVVPFPIWKPTLYTPGLWAMLLSLLALCVISFGVGTFATILLGAVSFCSPLVALRIYRSRIVQHLEGLLPQQQQG